MTTADLAKAFTTMLRAGEHKEAAARFNAPDIVSREAMDGPMSVCTGTAAVKAKSDWWYANHEIHSFESSDPMITGNQFLLRFMIDVTRLGTGERVKAEEFGLYTVRDGQIVEESFFYPTA